MLFSFWCTKKKDMWTIWYLKSECLNDSSRHIFLNKLSFFNLLFQIFQVKLLCVKPPKNNQEVFFLFVFFADTFHPCKGPQKERGTKALTQVRLGKRLYKCAKPHPHYPSIPHSSPPPPPLHPLSGEKWVKWGMTGPVNKLAAAVPHSDQRGARLSRVEARVAV